MPRTRVVIGDATNELRKGRELVGFTDEVYSLNGKSVTFKEILVKGDLSGILEYNGKRLKVRQIGTVTGLKVDMHGANGPVWEDVECEIL